MKPTPPVIIIGMHRSGTSMVMRLLEQFGLFVGRKLDPNHEATFFLDHNRWLFQQCGATWDNPQPLAMLSSITDTWPIITEYFDRSLRSPQLLEYLGICDYLKFRSAFNISRPWGWKDPRNTFTLPIWLELFPEARVIHVSRHGVDVANSLKVRHERLLRQTSHRFHSRKLPIWLRRRRPDFSDTLRCTTLEGGLSLWEEYTAQARGHVAHLKNQVMEVRYEEILEDPAKILQELANFSELNVRAGIVQQAVNRIRNDRAFAYTRSPELTAFAENNAQRLLRFGY